MNEKKLVSASFVALNIEQPSDICTLSDLTNFVSEHKDLISLYETQIELMKETIENSKRNMELAYDLIAQYRIEKYKALNPGKEVF